jgi:hypothetical protein
MTRVRQAIAAVGISAAALVCAATPASAAPIWVGVVNSGTGPVLVEVHPGPGLSFSVSDGCGLAPPAGAKFSVCLPGGAVLAFSVDVGAATD